MLLHPLCTPSKLDPCKLIVVSCRDHDASVYLKLQGDALHVGGYEVDPCFWDNVEKSFAFGLFELDWDVFGVHIEGAVNR